MEYPLLPIIIVLFVLLFCIYAVYTRYKVCKKLNYMLDALEDKEYNFKFSEELLLNKSLNKVLNRLRGIFEKERNELLEQESYYGHMLNHIKTGIIAIYPNGKVDFSNNQALMLLGVASLSNIRQLRRINSELYEKIVEVIPGQEIKVILFNETNRMNILLSASYATINGNEIKIVALNDISEQLSENEAESWSKLTRVLTHEVMNSIAPIASLSDILKSKATEGGLNEDYQAGLETISTSSHGLMKFVESYRNLTRIAAPVKKVLLLKDLINNVINLVSAQVAEYNASVLFSEKQEDILLYADEAQISQIIVNLIKNALQAGANRVEIVAELDFIENVVIHVINNGTPISKECGEQIFIPFFTTKQEGTGIGLSLSRQIMCMHGGSLRLTGSDEKATVFTLTFI